MKRILLVISGLILLLVSAFACYQAVRPTVKEDHFVAEGYTVKVFRNAQLQFPIYFKGLKTSISFDEKNPGEAKIVATIDATTVETGNESMTAHAKEPNVLDTEKFPVIKFESSAVRKTTSGYEVTGKLTLKGIIKEITIPFTFENEIFSGKFSILAKDFNITREGAVPSGEIKIELTVPLSK